MFLLMGEMILRSGVSTYFYRGVVVLLGRLPGGLLHANIFSCAIFAAVSGSSVATAATVGTVAIPEMMKRGYKPRPVFGSLAAGGTLGILIPPSIIMVLYGALVEESIARLFMAGVLPGLLMAGIFMIFIAIQLMLNPKLAPPRHTDGADVPPASDLLHVFPVLGLLVVVLGSIYVGFTTPTEAAAVGAAGALVLAAGYGGLNKKVFNEFVMATVQDHLHGDADHHRRADPVDRAHLLRRQPGGQRVDPGAGPVEVGVLLRSRRSLPRARLLRRRHLDDLHDAAGAAAGHQGVRLRPDLVRHHPDILIELGQITPPVGLNLFTIHAISGGAPFSEVVLGALPFVLSAMFLAILIISVWPGLALWLPSFS